MIGIVGHRRLPVFVLLDGLVAWCHGIVLETLWIHCVAWVCQTSGPEVDELMVSEMVVATDSKGDLRQFDQICISMDGSLGSRRGVCGWLAIGLENCQL